jgi:microcystin degradation protein MlrC
MRLFTATLATETNTFSPLPTSLENYRESVFFRAGEHPADAPRRCTAPRFVARQRAGRFQRLGVADGHDAIRHAPVEHRRDEVRRPALDRMRFERGMADGG